MQCESTGNISQDVMLTSLSDLEWLCNLVSWGHIYKIFFFETNKWANKLEY